MLLWGICGRADLERTSSIGHHWDVPVVELSCHTLTGWAKGYSGNCTPLSFEESFSVFLKVPTSGVAGFLFCQVLARW